MAWHPRLVIKSDESFLSEFREDSKAIPVKMWISRNTGMTAAAMAWPIFAWTQSKVCMLAYTGTMQIARSTMWFNTHNSFPFSTADPHLGYQKFCNVQGESSFGSY